MEKKLAMMKEKYEGHQENPLALKAVMSGDSPFEAKFRKFFTVVGEGESCLNEAILYDTFFGNISEREKEAFLKWMYSCCNNGVPNFSRAEVDKRPGKKVFAACLRAIGGVYKNWCKNQRYVWTNIRMNETKKRKAAEVA